ncbi:hypothetical protein BGZ83_004145 [Gryganskiella cystojenkinii]|nr:hypothetical protein BGZ83_004145 [Gryganskiella cystojenkinii]
MVPTVHPFFDSAQTNDFIDIRYRKDSSFEISYFAAHGLAAPSRAILAISGATFKNVRPNWTIEREQAPFQFMPLLKETTSDGKVLQIAETDAIDRYLARKYDLMGDDPFQEIVIEQFISNSTTLWNKFRYTFYRVPNPVVKAEGREDLVQNIFPGWIKNHERQLVGNGLNGHYVGNRLSLADIRAGTICVPIILGLTGNDLISEELTPGLWALKTGLESTPSFAAWMETEEYQALSRVNREVMHY